MKQTKLEKRVTSLEGVNTTAKKKRHDGAVITLKEVFERVIRVDEQAKMIDERTREMEERSIEDTKKFTAYAVTVIFLQVVNLLLYLVVVAPWG